MGSVGNKYRVHEVAKDFGVPTKQIAEILTKYAEGHHELTEVLLSREVIFTEDVERIFGKRQWASRTDELLAAKPEEEPKETESPEASDATPQEQPAEA